MKILSESDLRGINIRSMKIAMHDGFVTITVLLGHKEFDVLLLAHIIYTPEQSCGRKFVWNIDFEVMPFHNADDVVLRVRFMRDLRINMVRVTTPLLSKLKCGSKI